MSTLEASAKPKVALIAGPTASGKSALAVRLAQRLADAGRRTVVLNADSAQVYRDLQVLSARPTAEEMGGIEHRLFGAWDGAVACSAADWANTARGEIEQLHSEDAVPILVGGTGLYLRTLLEGIAPVPPIDDDVRKNIRAMSQSEARFALEREDPEAAARLAPRDAARTMRALEVMRGTGRPLAHWQANKGGGIGGAIQLTAAVLLPERRWLFERCDRRFAAMIESGAREEVVNLLGRQLDPSLPVMRAIGVREIADWIAGRATRDDMLARGQAATRQYAKRQYTWFRRQPPPDWVSLESESCNASGIDALLCLLLA